MFNLSRLQDVDVMPDETINNK